MSEVESFITAQNAVQAAQYRIDVLVAGIEQHLLSLQMDVRLWTAERQATLSLEDLEQITDDLVKARDTLLVVLMESGAAEPEVVE